LRLRARRLVFRLGVGVAPVAQRVGVALEMRMNVARHELIAAPGGRPIRPIMREQQNAANYTSRTAVLKATPASYLSMARERIELCSILCSACLTHLAQRCRG
jgi:hypothetical protein